MDKNTFNIPIFFTLFEKKDSPTNRLIERMGIIAAEHNVTEALNLCKVYENPENNQESILVYSLDLPTGGNNTSKNSLLFLYTVFEKLFDNYPSFTEPI